MGGLANGITSLRILLSVCLLLFRPDSVTFTAIYLACGLSDLLDGYIARKTDTATRLGAMLDSAADILFFGILLIIFLPALKPRAGILLWAAAIAAVRLSSLAIGFHKYHTLAALHTYANKATGLALFCFPLSLRFVGAAAAAGLVCAVASLSALEELAITLTSKELSRDVKGLFFR